ncbi:MAG: nuclear transport factor 2 family protein [Phaeodactylibacter sp.]|nr:nuclear transport factor 2 family protein [Phaeodactylibacter sp.]MCB9294002.1 nuclear transport factor 2 family protein [Lewinellaceae bacterium]
METLVKKWFGTWEKGDFLNLPVSENFRHTSPFGTINGKKAYLRLVEENQDKFLGYAFEIHDGIYGEDKACVRYTATQGGFTLDVSEWYYAKDGLIEEIIAHYHIGEIQEERRLVDSKGGK